MFFRKVSDCLGKLNAAVLVFFPHTLEGAGEQKNSLLLRTPDSTVPGSQSAQLFLMGEYL